MTYSNYIDNKIDILIESMNSIINDIEHCIDDQILNEDASKTKKVAEWVTEKGKQLWQTLKKLYEFVLEKFKAYVGKIKPVLKEDIEVSEYVNKRIPSNFFKFIRDAELTNDSPIIVKQYFDHVAIKLKKGHILKTGVIDYNLKFIKNEIDRYESGINSQASYDRIKFMKDVISDISKALSCSTKPDKNNDKISSATSSADNELKSKKSMNSNIHESVDMSDDEYMDLMDESVGRNSSMDRANKELLKQSYYNPKTYNKGLKSGYNRNSDKSIYNQSMSHQCGSNAAYFKADDESGDDEYAKDDINKYINKGKDYAKIDREDLDRMLKYHNKLSDKSKDIHNKINNRAAKSQHESVGLTRNELIASIMLEAADLLREDDVAESLNEGIISKIKSSREDRKNDKKLLKEVNSGKYNNIEYTDESIKNLIIDNERLINKSIKEYKSTRDALKYNAYSDDATGISKAVAIRGVRNDEQYLKTIKFILNKAASNKSNIKSDTKTKCEQIVNNIDIALS